MINYVIQNIMVAPLTYNYPDNSGTCLLDSYSYITGDNRTQLIFHDISEALSHIVKNVGEKVKNRDLTWYTAKFTLNNEEYVFHFLSSSFIGMEDKPNEIWKRLGLDLEIQMMCKWWKYPSIS